MTAIENSTESTPAESTPCTDALRFALEQLAAEKRLVELCDGVHVEIVAGQATLGYGEILLALTADLDGAGERPDVIEYVDVTREEARSILAECEQELIVVWDRAAGDAARLVLEDEGPVELARERLAESDEPRAWTLREEGYDYCRDSIHTSVEDALETARGNVERGNYSDAEGTIWIDVSVHCEATGESQSTTVQLDEDEPGCADGEEHEWESPHEIVKGIAENPGVWGKGGGAIIHEVCLRCGCARITDTWAQRRDTGEQGLTSVSYDRELYSDEIAEYRAAQAH